MARGFLSGALVGGVVSVVVAGGVSLMTSDLAVPDVTDQAPDAATSPVVNDAVQTEAATDADLVQDGASAVEKPVADDVAAVAQAGADRPVTPQTGTVDAMEDPALNNNTGAVRVQTEAPVLPSPQAVLPTASERGELSISTDPAQPPAPDVPVAETAFEDETATTDATQAPTQPVTPDAVPETSQGAETPTPEVAPEVVQEPASEGAEEEVAVLPDATRAPDPEARPSIGRPAGSLVNRDPEPTDAPEDVVTEAAPAPDLSPLQAFAVDFERSEGKPVMAIVLLDQGVDLGDGPVGLAALRSFPYPLTFAVDATLPDAAERAAAHRAEGFEVLALVDLPAGATPTDAEVTLGAALRAVPEAVGVLEGVTTGVQQERDASDQVTQFLAASGHGFILQSKGLNTAQKLAEREGVPSATVFRDFDSADQTPTVIRRFLDQAAFRAGQEGGVIMMGRLRADTISALILWGLQDRASRVDLAPVSVLLTNTVE